MEESSRIRDLFEQALNLSPDDRARLLSGCPDPLREELQRLLGAHDRLATVFDIELPSVNRSAETLEPQSCGLDDPDWSQADAADALRTGIDIHSEDFPRERFTLRGRLGAGGFGVVYRAFDQQENRDVALKTVRVFDGEDMYRLKREFRSLADIHHRHLVKLYELFVQERSCFFTMELVRGRHFLDCIRSEQHPPLLRELMRQLAEAVHAIHDAGKLHGDLKPSNVLVTDDHRVVVLDFGITTELGGISGSSVSQVAGTPLYMAPEALRNSVVSQASDWYAIGVMLYEALTGRPPFEGDTWQMLQAKMTDIPPNARALAGSPEPGMAALCLWLLNPDPSKRPGWTDIRDCFGSAPSPLTTAPSSSFFTGRQQHLRMLASEFARAQRGEALIVSVRGASGIGKTALLRRFMSDLSGANRPFILPGRCFESETVPYKGLDSAIDALSHLLKRLPSEEVETVLPRHFDCLVRMFPVLGRIVQRPNRRAVSDAVTPQEERRRASAALRELFGRLSDRWPLILIVDDAQWGDRDSAALIADVLRPPDAPRMLLVVSYRSNEPAGSFIQALFDGLDEVVPSLPHTIIDVDKLDPVEALALARDLLDESSPLAETVASESAGNPYLIRLFARHIASGADWGLTTDLTLNSVVRALVARVPADARQLLEILAVAACPLPVEVVCAAADIADDRGAVIDSLRAVDMVRTVSGDTGQMLETYHDRIRETVRDAIPADRRVLLHRRLAFALEAAPAGDTESIAAHFHAAGEIDRAKEHTLRAAEEAMKTFAFERAARLFRQALAWTDDVGTANLQVRLGDALASAGRGTEAADAYLSAVGRADSKQRIELLRRSAEQLLISGSVEKGLTAIRAVLDALDLHLPRSSYGALASLVYRRTLVRLRGLRFRERAESMLSETERMAIDTCWSVAVGMSMVDTIRGADFQARHLLLALRAGEPFRVARALALEVGHRGLPGTKVEAQVTRFADSARTVSARLADPYPSALFEVMAGALAWMSGRWRTCLERSDEAERRLVGQCGTPSWETTTARIFSMASLMWMGELAEYRRRLPPLIRDARDRGNLYAEVSIPLVGYATFATLADDRPAQAMQAIDRLTATWVTQRFDLQRFWATYGRTEIHLYNGDGLRALQEIESAGKAVERSLLLRTQAIRIGWMHLVARCELAAAHMGQRDRLSGALAVARKLDREHAAWATSLADLVRAGVAVISGEVARAVTLLKQAEAGFLAVNMKLHAAAAVHARRHLGSAVGDEQAAESRVFEAEGVVDPARFTKMLGTGVL